MALGPMTGIVDIAGTIRSLADTGKVDAWLLTKEYWLTALSPMADGYNPKSQWSSHYRR